MPQLPEMGLVIDSGGGSENSEGRIGMNIPVEPFLGTYREQLDRVRRFHKRLRQPYGSRLEFQDVMYSFFQNCWHLKDWIKNDTKLVSDTQRRAVDNAVHAAGSPFAICRDLCNGTKHLKLDHPSSGAGARHDHVNTTIWVASDRPRENDSLINDGTGSGALISGLKLADDCVAAWESVLKAQGLDVSQVFFG
jgi:hypothetical protein